MASEQVAPGSLAVVILTFNEEANIAQSLDSVVGWANEIHILDSFSTDTTLEIASRYVCNIAQHRFSDYASQRNHALEHLPIRSEWVLFLDADEWLPKALKEEISEVIAKRPNLDGYYISYRLIWMGTWIRHGYYPSWILRLFRYGKARCEDRAINEHVIITGATGRLQNSFVHQDRKGITEWIAKHNRYATREARELLDARTSPGYREITPQLFGPQAQRRRWLRSRVWNKLPILIRPLLYFVYRYVLRGGFLGGRPAFTFHFLHALWYPMLIDIKYLELKASHVSSRVEREEGL